MLDTSVNTANQALTNLVDPVAPPGNGNWPGRVGWVTPLGAPGPFAIDPLGVANGLNSTSLASIGGTRTLNPPASVTFPLPRFTLNWAWASTALADQVFRWPDELTFEPPANSTMRPRTLVKDHRGDVWPYPALSTDPPLTPPATDSSRQPLTFLNPNLGNFSWFLTATPTGQSGVYWASVVVCYKRNFRLDASNQPEGERTVDIVTPLANGFLGGGYAGGTVQLAPTIQLTPTNFPMKLDQWVMLVGWNINSSSQRVPVACQWYRVVGIGTNMSPPYLSLDGPDWDTTNPNINGVTIVVVDGVTGVYNSTIRLQ